MKHGLTFEWIGGNTSAADHMKNTFKAHGIPFRYGKYFDLQAALNGSDFVPVEYYHIGGQTFGIVEKPARTSGYFGIPAPELYAETADGYTREECRILDATEEGSPFCASLLDAVEKADYYRRHGYQDITILQTVGAKWYKYAVLARDYSYSH